MLSTRAVQGERAAKVIRRVYAALGLILLWSSPSISQELKVGVSLPMTGPLAVIGEEVHRAISLAVDEQNAKGGVLKRKVSVVLYDEAGGPQIAIQNAKLFVEQKIVGAIGHLVAASAAAAAEVYMDRPILFVALPVSGYLPPTKLGRNAFVFGPKEEWKILMGSEFLVKNLKVTRVLVSHPNQSEFFSWGTFAGKSLEKFGSRAVIVGSKGELWQDLSRNIATEKTEAVFYLGPASAIADAQKKLMAGGIKVPILAVGLGDDPAYLNPFVAGRTETYAVSIADASLLKGASAVRASYKKEVGRELGLLGVYGYSSAIVLFEAINKTGSLDVSVIVDYVRRNQFSTPLGRVRFDVGGYARVPAAAVWRITADGQKTVVVQATDEGECPCEQVWCKQSPPESLPRTR